MLDVLIKKAEIIDGTGQDRCRGDVGILDGKIVLNPAGPAAETVDADGLCLCPGFIDSHSHSDLELGKSPELISLCKISQGITTEVVGQCGSSLFPVPESDARFEDFGDFGKWLRFADRQEKAVNFAFLIGHGQIRFAVMGYDDREPTGAEMDRMKAYLRDAMAGGCFGMSSGLIYVPGVYAGTGEVTELCRVLKPFGGIYATHMRSESDHITEAVAEAIQIAGAAGIPLVISHHKVCGIQNWGASKETLGLVHRAIDGGMKVTMDQYPYTASQTGLAQGIPPKYFVHGGQAAAELLKQPAVRAKIREEMRETPSSYNNSVRNANGFGGVLILSCPGTPEAVGHTVADYARKAGKDEYQAYFDLMQASQCRGDGAFFCMDEHELNRIYLDPNTVVGTDGWEGNLADSNHPRAYASLVRALCYYQKQQGLLPFEKAVRKQTGLTAARWGLKNKGLIRDGYDADLVLLDYDSLRDRADYLHPRALCDGIERVYVNGRLAYRDKKMTGDYAGKTVLRR